MKNKLTKAVVLFGATLSLVGIASTVNAEEYQIKSGDTLSTISKKHYNQEDLFQKIAAFNKIDNADLIFTGEKLELPKLEELLKIEITAPTTTQPVVVAEEVIQEVREVAQVPVETPVETPVAQTGGYQLTVETTAYDAVSLGGLTASGYQVTSTGEKVIAVDPRVIPMGSTVYVPGYGTATAVDTGGAIQGNIIDLNMNTADAIQWGRRVVTITVY